jgi:hypothetical protein
MKTIIKTFLTLFFFSPLVVNSQQIQIKNVDYKLKKSKLIVYYKLEDNSNFFKRLKNSTSYDDVYFVGYDTTAWIKIGLSIQNNKGEFFEPKKLKGDCNWVSKSKGKRKIIWKFKKDGNNVLEENLYVSVFDKNNPSVFCQNHDKTFNNSVKSTYTSPPILSLSGIQFQDENDNDRIDGNESCSINFSIKNSGNGIAKDIVANISNESEILGLSFEKSIAIGNIEPNQEKQIKIPINSNEYLKTGISNLKISFQEQMGFPPDPIVLSIETREYIKPDLQIVDYKFLTNSGLIKLGLPIQLKVLVQNIGQGTGNEVKVSFIYPNENVFPNGEDSFELGDLHPGSTKELVFEFIANKLYKSENIPVKIEISEKLNKYNTNKDVIAKIDEYSSGNTITIASNLTDKSIDIKVASLTAEVDKNIPQNLVKIPNRFALIIGNEDYSSRQTNLSSESNVDYAVNDALVFKDYCINTLGIEDRNVFLLTNATAGEMSQKIELVTQILRRLDGKGELIFYYAGHGFPDENTKIPYLIPVDVNATNLNSAIKLKDVFDKFSSTNSKRITVFLDACFTGGGRNSGLIAARGVRIKPKVDQLSGNFVVFSATSEEQSALPYDDKKHGIFTYFLLKKIQETKGDVTYGDLENYIKEQVSIESLVINKKPQDPKINVSYDVQSIWEKWILK